MTRARMLLPLLLLLGGCVYYNGMYNTKNLAKRARHAERDGRTFEAANYWGQVSVKAETLLVHHPRSKYAEEARLLYGTARAKLNDCAGALPELESVMLGTRNPGFAEDAAEMVGWCRVTLGEPASAAEIYARLTNSSNKNRRDLALYAHGQALRMNGQYADALGELRVTSHPRARGERAAALAGLGDTAALTAVIDTLLTLRDSLAPWGDIVGLVARKDAVAGSALTDRLVATAWLSPRRRGRLLIDDAARLSQGDPARGLERLQAVEALADGTELVGEARVLIGQQRLMEAATPDSLRAIATELGDMQELAGSFMPVVQRLATQARRAAAAADGVAPGSPDGELRLFVAAELARDSLNAPRFAAAQFRRVVDEWPTSPFAPKALLALILLEPVAADSLQQRMRASYGASPYLLLVDGTESPQLGALEDSLRHFVSNYQPARTTPQGTPARPGARPNRPATTLEPQ